MSSPLITEIAWLTPIGPPVLSDMVQGVSLLIALGLYFWFVFGQLSRRFERQADVFGSKVVSCDLADCPPHSDLDHDLSRSQARRPEARYFARSESGSLPTPSRMWRGVTAWTRTADRGGTAASPAGSHFSRASSGIRSSSIGFSAESRWLRLGLGVILLTAILFSLVQRDGGALVLTLCPESSLSRAFAWDPRMCLPARSASSVIVPPRRIGYSPGTRHTRPVPTTRRSSCSDGQFGSS